MATDDLIGGTLITRKGIFSYEYCHYYFPDIKVYAYIFEIWDDGDVRPRKYSFILEIVKGGTYLKVMDMFANDYKGKGISIPMILRSKELFNKQIISSSNKYRSRPGKANWPEGIEKVWEPMVKQGLAVYNCAADRYEVL